MNQKKDIFDRIMDWKLFDFIRPFYQKYKEVLMYLFFGGLTTVVSIGSFAIFERAMNPLLANIISWIFAVTFAYVTNRIWVFRSTAEKPIELVRECLSFFGGRVATLVMEEIILYIGIDCLGCNAVVVKVAAQVLVLIGNYLISKLLVFRGK